MAIPIEAYGDDDLSRRPYKSRAELQAMSNTELADYIERGLYDDHFSHSARVGLVRVLRQLAGNKDSV